MIIVWLLSLSLLSCTATTVTTSDTEELASRHWQCIDRNLGLDDGISPVSEIAAALTGLCFHTRDPLLASQRLSKETSLARVRQGAMVRVLQHREALRLQEGL